MAPLNRPQHSTSLHSQFGHFHFALMLLSIKSIATLSLAKLILIQAGQSDYCDFKGPYNRLNPANPSESLLMVEEVQTISPNPCLPIAGQVGVPVCQTQLGTGECTPQQFVWNNRSPCLSPPNQLSADASVFRSVSYYYEADFACDPPAYPACRYCAVPDYAVELRRDLIYSPSSGDNLATVWATPFNCGAPKCPPIMAIPGTSHPTLYATLSAAYCISNEASLEWSAYGGLLPNYVCALGMAQRAINQKWSCYIEVPLKSVVNAVAPEPCDGDLTAMCYYDIPKPASYPAEV